jgi:hypothetical protein
MPRATYATLRQILLGLGFQVQVVPGSHIRFGRDPKTWVLLPPFRDDEPVDVGNLFGVRRLLDARRLLSSDRFDEMVWEHSLAR